MLLPLIVTMFILSHLGLPLLLCYLFVALTPPHHRAVVHALSLHHHSHHQHHQHHQHSWRPFLQPISTQYHEHSEVINGDVYAAPSIQSPRGGGLDLLPGTSDDDWTKWHEQQHVQQAMRRKLECQGVEFGRCEVGVLQRRQEEMQRRQQELKKRVAVVEERAAGGVERRLEGGDVGGQEGDEFAGRRLPRGLGVWLAAREALGDE